ncbi:MAG: hypothetical protein AAB525_03455 [Patescibacteria group bacterium]
MRFFNRRILKLDAADEETFRRANRSRHIDREKMPIEISTAVIDIPAICANFDSIRSQNYVEILDINPYSINVSLIK